MRSQHSFRSWLGGIRQNLRPYWPRSMPLYGVTGQQYVKAAKLLMRTVSENILLNNQSEIKENGIYNYNK